MIFVEDPGPANYIATLPAALAKKGRETTVYAAGLAREHLQKRGIRFEPVSPFMTADYVLSKICPRLLLTGTSENPDSLGLSLILAARRERITSVGLIDAGVNASYRFRGHSDEALAYAPDWILVPDDWTRDEFIRIGMRKDRLCICGHPHYDYVLRLGRTWTLADRIQMRHRYLPGLGNRQQVVVFLSEGSERISLLSPSPSPVEYSLRGWGTRTGRTEIIIEEFLEAVQNVPERPYLVLRLHPKDQPDDFRDYKTDFDRIDHTSPPLELIFCADLVVGMTSMLLLEAVLLGRKTLSIVPREVEKDWLPTVRQGITPCVMTRIDLTTTLNDFLRNEAPFQPSPHFCVANGSLERLVHFIDEVLIHGG